MGNVIPADTIKNLAQAQKTHNESVRASGITSQIVEGIASNTGRLLMGADKLDVFPTGNV
jgi:hypothetical protein